MTRKSLPEEIADALNSEGRLFGDKQYGIYCIKRAIDRHTKRNAPKKDPRLADLLRQYDAAKRRAWYHSKVPTEVEGKRAKYPSDLQYKKAMAICAQLQFEIKCLAGEAPRPFNPRA